MTDDEQKIEVAQGVIPGRLHHKSLTEKDFFEVGFIPAGGKAFVLDADFET